MELDDVVRQAKQNPLVEVIIQYSPTTGQLALRCSNVDDVMKLGMLETAKSLIIEERVKKAGAQGVLSVPTGVLS